MGDALGGVGMLEGDGGKMKHWFVAWRHHEVMADMFDYGSGVESHVWFIGPILFGWDRQIVEAS